VVKSSRNRLQEALARRAQEALARRAQEALESDEE